MSASIEPQLVIGTVSIDPPLVLAPMAGICDRYFRMMIRRLRGAGLISMEFISSEAVTRGIKPILDKMIFDPAERPLAIQIYGKDPQRMADCASLVQEMDADICDINMGCPANKILKGCAGAALMRDLTHAGKIIEACRKRLTIPLTVKFRMGMGKGADPVNYLELGRICEDLGVDAITLHARTAKQMFSGRADWEQIRQLKQAVKIPVIGNGDVTTCEDALEMFRQTGCDGVMIGRAALRDPWIFGKAAALLKGEPAPEVTLDQRRDLMLAHFGWVIRDEEPRAALHRIRTFTGHYTRGLAGSRQLRQQIGRIEDPAEFLPAIMDHFARL